MTGTFQSDTGGTSIPLLSQNRKDNLLHIDIFKIDDAKVFSICAAFLHVKKKKSRIAKILLFYDRLKLDWKSFDFFSQSFNIIDNHFC